MDCVASDTGGHIVNGKMRCDVNEDAAAASPAKKEVVEERRY